MDCLPPADADELIARALEPPAAWGRFNVRIAGQSRWLRLVAWSMNHRSRLTGICTGDQGIFVTRGAYDQSGGIPPIALMEDIAFSKVLKRFGRPACIRQALVTSGRRWDRHGVLSTILFMWRLRLRYFFGADPTKLHRMYYGGAPKSKER
jgi:hypothetical protein